LKCKLSFTEDSRNHIVTARSLTTGQNHAKLQLPIHMQRSGITRHQTRRRLSEQVREQFRDLICKRRDTDKISNYMEMEVLTENWSSEWRERETRIASGGALGTVDDDERVFENGGERERVVDSAVLDLAVDGGESAGVGRRSDSGAGKATVDCERRRHWNLLEKLWVGVEVSNCVKW